MMETPQGTAELAAIPGYPPFLSAVGIVPIGYPKKSVNRPIDGRSITSFIGTGMTPQNSGPTR
jgi:hypothetical protein